MFRLATALGYPHPDLLLRELTARQLAELRAYYQFEPFGGMRTDIALAKIAQLLGAFVGVKVQSKDMIFDATRLREKRATDEKARYEETKRTVAKFLGVDPEKIASVRFEFTKPKKRHANYR